MGWVWIWDRSIKEEIVGSREGKKKEVSGGVL